MHNAGWLIGIVNQPAGDTQNAIKLWIYPTNSNCSKYFKWVSHCPNSFELKVEYLRYLVTLLK